MKSVPALVAAALAISGCGRSGSRPRARSAGGARRWELAAPDRRRHGRDQMRATSFQVRSLTRRPLYLLAVDPRDAYGVKLAVRRGDLVGQRRARLAKERLDCERGLVLESRSPATGRSLPTWSARRARRRTIDGPRAFTWTEVLATGAYRSLSRTASRARRGGLLPGVPGLHRGQHAHPALEVLGPRPSWPCSIHSGGTARARDDPIRRGMPLWRSRRHRPQSGTYRSPTGSAS